MSAEAWLAVPVSNLLLSPGSNLSSRIGNISRLHPPKHQIRWVGARSWEDSTARHPFWVVGRGWTAAGDLRPGECVVGRLPTSAEWKRVSEHIEKAKDKQKAVEDALWAVLNTREFLFNH